MKLAVVGAGIAGHAAAFFACRRGVHVTLFGDAQRGASALTSGAADLAPWQAVDPAEELSDDATRFARELDLWALKPERAWVISAAGLLRPARACDPCVLDVSRFRGRSVGVVSPLRAHDFDVEGLQAAAEAQHLEVRFEAVAAVVSGEVSEPGLALQETSLDVRHPEVDAWLLPEAWVASRVELERWRTKLSRPVGVPLSEVGGNAGLRLVAQLSAWRAPHLTRRAAQVRSLYWTDHGVQLSTEGAPREEEDREHFDACIVAIGGPVGGGLALSNDGRLVASVSIPQAVLGVQALDGHFDVASKSGVDFSTLGDDAIERIGFLDPNLLATAPGPGVCRLGARTWAVGDCVASSKLTALGAVESAVSAMERLAAELDIGSVG